MTTGIFHLLLLLSGANPPPDFQSDVLPLLTKAGCNSGACHGAAAGRGGLHLSLFAGNPAADYDAIVRELEGRRINRSRPADSLLLAKPTGMLDHEGGVRFDFDSSQAKLLTDWVAAGALRGEPRQVLQLLAEPSEGLVDTTPATVTLKVTMQFDDGGQKDVTSQAVFIPADDTATTITPDGQVSVLRAGRHVVIVRYLTQVRAVTITAPLRPQPVDLAAAPRGNWIDDEVYATLTSLHLPPSPPASDATLLRRVTLDLTGRLPKPQTVRDYLANPDPRKFEKQVDHLLKSDEFTEYWTFRWSKLLRVRTQGNEQQATAALHDWIHQQIATAAPLDKMASQLLTTDGDSHEVGPANLHRLVPDARAQAEYFGEVFLGMRIKCANCHNHPLDRWTQDDYHGLAAIFAPLERGRIVRFSRSGEVIHPLSGQAALARILGERFLETANSPAASQPKAPTDHRPELTAWLTDTKNPRFARAQVNRLWKALLGRGLVEPADDLRDTNPASHPKLLGRLTTEFIASGFNLRGTLRLIALSAAYQRSSTPTKENRGGEVYYAVYPWRTMDAEVLLDAIGDVTLVPEELPGNAQRAIQVVDGNHPSETLDVLGRCAGQENCEAGGSSAGGIDQLPAQLLLLNGKLLSARLRQPHSVIQAALKDKTPLREIINDLYLRAFGREPTASELSHWEAELAGKIPAAERSARLEDFAWALLTSREFVTNH